MAPSDSPASTADSSRVARQLAELSLIYNIGRSLSATLDLDALLTRVVEAAVSLTNAEEGLLLLPDAESGELTIRAAKNIDDQLVRTLRLRTQDSLAGRVMQNSKPILVNNDSGWEKIKTEYLVKSLIYVPLIAKGKTLGVLGVDNKVTPIVFSEHNQDLLTALASYAAVAIENAQLYEDAVTRARELALLAETASAVSSSLDLHQVLKAITRKISQGLQVTWCRISLWERDAGVLRTLAEYRAAIWERADGPNYDLSRYPQTFRLLTEGTPITVASNSNDDPGEQIFLNELGTRHMLAVPLEVAGAIIGLVRIFRDELPGPFDPTTIAASRQAAQRITPLFLARQVTSKWREEVLTGAESLLRVTGGDWCILGLWDADTNRIYQALEYGNRGAPASSSSKVLRVADVPIYRDVLTRQQRQVIRGDEPRQTGQNRALLERVRAHTLLVVPLVFKDIAIGLLELGDTSPERTLTNRELDLADALSNHAATAIENARLFGDLQQSIHDLQTAQSQLVQSARLSALGELAAVVAHQIKNPLTTIMGDAEILAQDLPPGQTGHESASAILRAGQRAKTVVDRLLNMTRPASRTQPLDVNETIEAALALVSSQLQANGNQLEVHLTPDLPLLEALPGQLEDVWLNLLLNSRDALLECGPGTIGISSALDPDGDALWVTVSDSGGGISEENLERIFDPFFTTKPHGKGTGLGLYICQQIVEQHNGQIEVRSRPGQGTQVSVWLPLR